MTFLGVCVPFAFLLMQCIASQKRLPFQSLSKLDDLVTNRIRETLKQEEYTHPNGGFREQYYLLAVAANLPLSLLDEKIEVYNAFKAYNESQLQTNDTLVNNQIVEQDNQDASDEDHITTRAGFNKFEKRVLKLLMKLGIYDPFTERVFRAIFSDEKQLRKLKKKLDELGKDKKDDDKDDESDKDSLWDFIYGLFL